MPLDFLSSGLTIAYPALQLKRGAFHRHLEILRKRREIKSRTIEERKGYNDSVRKQGKGR
jgi:hypothetical protein